MNVEIPFVIFTSDRSIYDAELNAQRRGMLERQLTARGLDWKRVEGSYAGSLETSYVVLTPNDGDEHGCLQLARRYGQDSVLIVDANRYATLAYLHPGNGGPDIRGSKPVGFWRHVTRQEAEESGSYTRDGDTYYTTRVAL
jgi:hypothetical protein